MVALGWPPRDDPGIPNHQLDLRRPVSADTAQRVARLLVATLRDVFGAGERSEYTLEPPVEGAQLETVEVQQFGTAMVAREDGVDFATRATWVLSVDDRA